MRITVELAIGAIIGAPVGAAVSRRVEGSSIIRLLALALAVVGIRLLWLRAACFVGRHHDYLRVRIATVGGKADRSDCGGQDHDLPESEGSSCL